MMHSKTIFFILSIITLIACRQKSDFSQWTVYRGGEESNCYSSLDQINAENVHQLKAAWIYHTRDSGESIQCNPIVVDDIMYVTSPAVKVIALHAATGKMIWTFDPFKDRPALGVNRGVVYHKNGKEKRIFFTAGYHLYCLDAESGTEISTFGDKGRVDLRAGLDREPENMYLEVTSPGVIFNELLILGSRVSEGEGAAPGHVRAFNILSGRH